MFRTTLNAAISPHGLPDDLIFRARRERKTRDHAPPSAWQELSWSIGRLAAIFPASRCSVSAVCPDVIRGSIPNHDGAVKSRFQALPVGDFCRHVDDRLGRPSKDLHVVIGVLLLQQLHGLASLWKRSRSLLASLCAYGGKHFQATSRRGWISWRLSCNFRARLQKNSKASSSSSASTRSIRDR